MENQRNNYKDDIKTDEQKTGDSINKQKKTNGNKRNNYETH